MTKEEDVLAARDKPRAIYSLQQRLDPGNKSTDALQELLTRMRAEGKVKFDINTGRWRKACDLKSFCHEAGRFLQGRQ
jgi:hypothetical protein